MANVDVFVITAPRGSMTEAEKSAVETKIRNLDNEVVWVEYSPTSVVPRIERHTVFAGPKN